MRPDRRIRDRRHGPATGRRSRRDAWDLDRRPAPPDADGFEAGVIPLHPATSGLEPELAALSAELAIAGARARAGTSIGRVESDDELAPSATFAADLRARLLAQFPAPVAAGAAVAAGAGATRPAPLAAPVTFDGPAIPGVLQPVRSALFDQLAAPRWTALAAAAVIVFAAVGLATDRVTPNVPMARIASATGASIVHGGAVRAAAAGAPLAVGDVVRVADGGDATVTIDASEARLGPGASIELDEVDASRIELVQLGGRVYHRVDVPAGQTYAVRTASITWTARGTAFDVERTALGAGTERVTVLAVQHSIAIDGPDLDGSLSEGRRAVVVLSGASPDVHLGEVDGSTLADPWLVVNAERDRAEGRSLGILAGRRPQEPSNRGGRRSTNAVMPSA